MSLIEAIANVAVGFGVAVITQVLVFPMFGIHFDDEGESGRYQKRRTKRKQTDKPEP